VEAREVGHLSSKKVGLHIGTSKLIIKGAFIK